MITPTPRRLAVEVLLRREMGGLFTEELLAAEATESTFVPADRALLQELVYGVVRWQRTLDWLVARKTPARRVQKASVQILLRLGLYQLFWLERIPDHAAVNETVELAKQLGCERQSGFINAILRAYLRERQETEHLLAQLRINEPALGHSHPDWLFNRWKDCWSLEPTIALLAWNNEPAKIFARANSLLADPERLPAIWESEKVVFQEVSKDWFAQGIVFELRSLPHLKDLTSFRTGLFYVQDPSTLLSVYELDPKSGERVLDLCAAPGGKTTYIAQRMQNQGRIVAADLDQPRLKLLEENCRRLGVTCVELRQLPAAASPPASEQFDRVLLDAPCSNTGVLRRRVDLRWRLRAKEIERLSESQIELLNRAARFLRVGGTLVYSTCSLEPEENRQVVERFLDDHPKFQLEHERQLLPFVDKVDGAYVARLSHRG
jgi:16S rRNA (cytosine967-C5)-methyltransferase